MFAFSDDTQLMSSMYKKYNGPHKMILHHYISDTLSFQADEGSFIMKVVFFLGLVTVTMVGCIEVDSLEDLDIEALLQSEDQRNAAYDCLMDKAPCGKLQKLRDSIPTMIETKCAQCTPKQKEKFDQVNKMLFSKYPKQFQELLLKYSPKSD